MVTGGVARPEMALPAEERTLRATIDGLTQLDPAALTIQQICRAAEVTAPTIYYHFGNKDGLLAAAVERLVTEWLAMMDSAVDREGSLDQTLEQAVTAWESTITSPTRPITVFAWVTLLLAGSSEECRDAILRARDRALALVTEALARTSTTSVPRVWPASSSTQSSPRLCSTNSTGTPSHYTPDSTV